MSPQPRPAVCCHHPQRRVWLFQDPPTFTVRPKEEYFQEVGRELVIPCTAHGDPPPTITWGKVGEPTWEVSVAFVLVGHRLWDGGGGDEGDGDGGGGVDGCGDEGDGDGVRIEVG